MCKFQIDLPIMKYPLIWSCKTSLQSNLPVFSYTNFDSYQFCKIIIVNILLMEKIQECPPWFDMLINEGLVWRPQLSLRPDICPVCYMLLEHFGFIGYVSTEVLICNFLYPYPYLFSKEFSRLRFLVWCSLLLSVSTLLHAMC